MRPEAISFAERADPATLPEWMDQPCSYEEFRACLVDLAQANRLTLAYRPTLQWLGRVARANPGKPLHIVDVGCGGGDMLRRIARWARRHGVEVRLTGVDLNPHSIRAAREFTPSQTIEFRCGDVYGYAPAGGIDVVISSLMTHHLAEAEIIAFLAWMDRTAQCGWFANDLSRSRTAYGLFTALARVMRWHRFVQHDGPVSIRRGFRPADWRRLCAAAGVTASVAARFPFRLCAGAIR